MAHPLESPRPSVTHSELAIEIGKALRSMLLSDHWEDRDDDNKLEKVDVLEDKVDRPGGHHRQGDR